jgi:tetratricopeptide (TPR) repeat protein
VAPTCALAYRIERLIAVRVGRDERNAVRDGHSALHGHRGQHASLGCAPDRDAGSRGIPNQRLLCALLNNSAEAALHFDDLDTALDRLKEAVAIGEATDDSGLLVYAKRNLGTVLVAQGEAAAAVPVLRDALLLAERNGAPVAFAYALMACAFARSSVGDDERAAALHGAADAVFTEIGSSPEPLEMRLRNEDVERIRSRIGDDAFDAASRRGAGLSRDDVVALAVERAARSAFSSFDDIAVEPTSGS